MALRAILDVQREVKVTQWRSGTPERIRTSDLRLRRPTLYPAELRALSWFGADGLRSPTTDSLGVIPVDALRRAMDCEELSEWSSGVLPSTLRFPALRRVSVINGCPTGPRNPCR